MTQDVANARRHTSVRLIAIGRFVMDPLFWVVLGIHLERMRPLLKPYASADVRGATLLIGMLFTTAGVIRGLMGIMRDPRPKRLRFTGGYGMGLLVGLMAGAGWILVAVTTVPAHLRLAGLLLTFLASTLFVAHCRSAEQAGGSLVGGGEPKPDET